MGTGTRAAVYLRVSKGERHTENQRPDVERVIATRELKVVAEYEEKASAAKMRPVFDRMIREAHRGAFDVVVVWALDRFGRRGSRIGGFVVGTPMYMAPEVLLGESGALSAADVFSFGVMAFEMCAGTRTFGATLPGVALRGEGASRHVALQASGLARDAGEILERCLRVEPRDRPTARDVARALARFA